MNKKQVAALVVNVVLMVVDTYKNDIAKYSEDNPDLLAILDGVDSILDAVITAAEAESVPDPEPAPEPAPEEVKP